MINKILFITLSNLGDVVLTLPVLDILQEKFPAAKITVMTAPRPKEIFENNPSIDKLIIYNKHSKLRDKIKLFNQLKKEKFDAVFDLRNSLYGAFLPAKIKISPFLFISGKIKHMKERRLRGALSAMGVRESPREAADKKSLYISRQDEECIKKILEENGLAAGDKIIVIAPGARSHLKMWDKDKFAELIPFLIQEFSAKIILVGDKDDAVITEYLKKGEQKGDSRKGRDSYLFTGSKGEESIIDLAGKITFLQLAALLKKAKILVSNDSAVSHLASYLNVPVAAIFGPTNEEKYGPWSEVRAVVKKDIFCRPCQAAQCRFDTVECMNLIKVEDVIRDVRNILGFRYPPNTIRSKNNFKRILIVRTDRIGDVVLSTPVIKALRDEYPNAYIAMMVSPYTKEIVEVNPYLDDVIIYDKSALHKSWYGSLKFSSQLKKKRFDVSLILHPTSRAHLVIFFARIPRRIGYDYKLGFLLTKRIKHTKQLGEKHEVEYSLDLVRALGIEPKDKKLFVPIRQDSEDWVETLFSKEGIKSSDKILAIHPGASCPSRIWPQERFARVGERVVEKYGFKVIVVGGAQDSLLALNLVKHSRIPVINLTGRASISQLASILKRCKLFISTDSGPMHIAVAVGTPVITIFGRNQKGLSPKRWGPLGERDKILHHKEAGCIECLAHNCKKEFACLKAVSIEDVIEAADAILTRPNCAIETAVAGK